MRKTFFVLFLLLLCNFAFSENERIGFSLGTEGGTIYAGSVICGEVNFQDSCSFNSNENIYLENFCGLQFTNQCADLSFESLCFFLDKEKVTLASGLLTHFDFLYGIDFEYDLLLNLKSIFGKKKSLYNFLFEFDLAHKGMFLYSLPQGHRYMADNGFGINACNQFNISDDWKINFGFRTWELYKIPASLSFTFYLEAYKKFLTHYEINSGLYLRYLDQNNTTFYFDYLAFRLGFAYIF